MSLATRCFACGTVFRVVQDQLKVSEGWVRCGRCNEVFNALESLFDLERDPPPEWSPGEAPSVATALAESAAAPPAQPTESPQRDRIDAQLVGTRRAESGTTPAARVDERDRLEFPDAQFAPESMPDEVLLAPIHDTTLVMPSEPDGNVTSPPEFVRHAQRRARWQQPMARVGLSVAAVLLLAALTLQAGHHFRDTVAMRWPATKPALVEWCGAMACSIQPPARIEDIVVESTALTRAAAPETFNLGVTLRNRGAMALAVPSVDLGLTDAAGQLVARRVLAPAEWRLASPTIAAGTELPLQLLLTAGSARVTGYTVEIFYP